MISTRNLTALPNLDDFRRLSQSLAMLDAILCPTWEFRYYSFNAAWSDGEQMASMRDGSGDELFAHFTSAGCWIKGFAHGSPMTPYREHPKRIWPGVYDAVPAEFAACLGEPAFSTDDVTFCIWRRRDDDRWRVGPIQFPPEEADPDGSAGLLAIWDGKPETYRHWATEYFEREVDPSAVEHVYRQQPLTAEIVARLNLDLSLDDLAADVQEIGYPQ